MANVEVKYIGVDAGATKVGNDVTKSIDGVEVAAKKATGGVGGFFKDAFSFATGGAITAAIGGIANAVGGLVSGMVKGNAEFETYETQFGVLLGSADAAKQRLADLAKFGASTPFELPEVVKADKILQGFGLHSEESAKKFGKSGAEIRRIAGDVASGTGQGFEEMALLLGKFSSGATGEAISRMAELGITTREEMAKLGLEFSKSGELLSPLPQAMQVVTDLMDKKYGGMMDKQSQTFDGMLSNFNDWVAGTMRAAGAPIFDKLKDGLGTLMATLNTPEMQAAITSVATLIGDVLSGAIGTAIPIVEGLLKGVAALATGGFGKLFETFGDGRGAMEGVFKSFGLGEDAAANLSNAIGDAIGFIGKLFTGFAADGDGFMQIFTDIQETIKNVFGAVVELVGAELQVVADFFAENGDEIMAFVKDTWDNILEIIDLALQLINATIVPALKAVAKFISDNGTEIGAIFKGAWDVISGIIDIAVTLIKGIIKTALQLLNGDIDGALGTIKDTFTRVWDNIKQVVQGAWDFISGIVKLASEAIAKLTGQQQSASGITVSYNPNFGQGNNVASTQTAGRASASNSYSLGGDTYNVANTDVAEQVQKARKQAAQQAMLRMAVGT